jgi:hypoxanthine phosphoribosyltransferase
MLSPNSLKEYVKTKPRLLYLARFLLHKKYRIVPIVDQVSLTKEWVKQLPNQFDCIVCIPRSAVIISNIIALHFATAWATVDGFLRGEIYQACNPRFKALNHVLLVDDCIGPGLVLENAKQKLQTVFPSLKVSTGALFQRETSTYHADYVYKKTYATLTFEWDFLEFTQKNVASDLDGVLCHELAETTSPTEFLEEVKTAVPYLIPAFTLEAIITFRPETVRKETEEWLSQYGVKYDKLIMNNGYNSQENFKVDEIKKCNPSAYFESELTIAKVIKKKTHVLTYCVERGDWL